LEDRGQVELDHIGVIELVLVLGLSGLSSVMASSEIVLESLSSSAHSSAHATHAAHASSASEELREDIIEIHAAEASSRVASALLLADSLGSKLIVGLPLFLITEGLVCKCDFLELCLRSLRVILVLVRMVLDRQLLELLLDLLLSGRLLYSKYLIVIILFFLLGRRLLTPLASSSSLLPAEMLALVASPLGLNSEAGG